jgi:hypothetical protein
MAMTTFSDLRPESLKVHLGTDGNKLEGLAKDKVSARSVKLKNASTILLFQGSEKGKTITGSITRKRSE